MRTLIREERYVSWIGTTDYILRVEELIEGTEAWPAGFRIRLPASHFRKSKTVYGNTALDAVRKAIEYIAPTAPTSGLYQ